MIHPTEHTDSGEPILASVEEVPIVEVELPEWTGPFLTDAELSACDAEYDAYYGDLGVGRRR
jgi:hypothetical protein